MELKKERVDFIDRLRDAAKHHGAVVDLLVFMDAVPVIEDGGFRDLSGDEEDIEHLRAALIAAKFVMADRGLLEADAEEGDA